MLQWMILKKLTVSSQLKTIPIKEEILRNLKKYRKLMIYSLIGKKEIFMINMEWTALKKEQEVLVEWMIY
jgi:hypothetical protein